MGFLYSQFLVTPKYPTTSFEGQTIIVTGANSGLGKEAARHFVRLGAAEVVLAVRNTSAGEEAKAEITGSTKCDPNIIKVRELDLCSYGSIKAFAERMSSELSRIDVLMENAGIHTYTHKICADSGCESTIAVNVVGTFLLGFLLLSKLKATAQQFNTHPRWSIVSSELHGWKQFPEWKEDDIFGALNKAPVGDQYEKSKLIEILVVRAICASLEGSGVVLNLINPGFCQSSLAREYTTLFMRVLKATMARSTEVGSRTLVAAAAAGPESHGKYMSDGEVKEAELSAFVRSDEGTQAAVKVWSQLKSILEKAQPGVTAL